MIQVTFPIEVFRYHIIIAIIIPATLSRGFSRHNSCNYSKDSVCLRNVEEQEAEEEGEATLQN